MFVTVDVVGWPYQNFVIWMVARVFKMVSKVLFCVFSMLPWCSGKLAGLKSVF